MTRRRKVILIDVLLAVAIVVVAGRFISSLINQQVAGPVSVGKPEASGQIEYTINLAPKAVVEAYADYSVPESLKLKTPQPLSGAEVQAATYTVTDIASWVLSVDITRTNGQLSDNSSWTLFKSDPKEYTESQTLIKGQTIYIMTDITATGFSKAAFFTHGDYVGVVSLTGDDANGTVSLQTTLNMVLNAWHWQV